jgi:P4 family phage/plasmid primase-like protien
VMPKSNDFYGSTMLSDEEFEKRKSNVAKYQHIWISTVKVQQIDVDDPEYDHSGMTDDMPYYESVSKKLPHVFVHLNNNTKYGKRECLSNNDKLEMLNGQGAYCLANAVVYNADSPIQQVSDEILKGYREATATPPSLPPPVYNNTENDNDMVTELLQMINPARADDYAEWTRIGMCLKCLDPVHNIKLWIEWSKQSPKFDNEAACVAKWATFSNTGMSLGSLRFWARTDSPEVYKEFSESNVESIIYNIESNSEYPIATLIHALYSDRFVSIAAKSDYIWYEFGKHRWERNNGFHLKGIMNMELHTLFNNKIMHHKKEIQRIKIEILNEKKKNLDDNSLLEELGRCLETHTEKAKLYKTICDSLHKNNYKNGLLDECGLLFQRPESDKFVERLDEHKHLLGFNNGVFDLDQFVFRDGLPDDMITFTTGYDYTDQVNQTTRDSIMTFKRNIMSNEDMTTYLLNTEAYALHGDKYLQHIHIQIGIGSNGKSVNSILNKRAFGEYFYAPDIGMFTNKRATTGGTNSELVKSKGKRMLLGTEPEADERLQASRVKAVTGGDMVQARALYAETMEFCPQFSVVLQMNSRPILSGFDQGVSRRLKFVPFNNKFMDPDKINTDDVTHREIDKTLTKRFDTTDYAQQYMLLLLEYFNKNVRGCKSFGIPECADTYTSDYLGDEDVVKTFIDTWCIRTDNKKDRISSKTLFEAFRSSEFYRPIISKNNFPDHLFRINLQKIRVSGVWYWSNLKLNPPVTEEEDLGF